MHLTGYYNCIAFRDASHKHPYRLPDDVVAEMQGHIDKLLVLHVDAGPTAAAPVEVEVESGPIPLRVAGPEAP